MPQQLFTADQLDLLFERDSSNAFSEWVASDAQLTQWVLAALTHSLPEDLLSHRVEVSISCVSAERIGELNSHYRSTDKPTNVLSYESDELPIALLGDVIVCPEVLVAEAQEQGKSIEHHWAHMVIHSVLHLNGFDHEDENTAQAMESLEIQILSTLGISNPYLAIAAK
ncbi:UNVERIFIED_CONTAM: hypothetical protein GTU68_032243 [Idotea baltica]|nr:hypothetical protein [Idotea baltica]